jgi:hypothetical protein
MESGFSICPSRDTKRSDNVNQGSWTGVDDCSTRMNTYAILFLVGYTVGKARQITTVQEKSDCPVCGCL